MRAKKRTDLASTGQSKSVRIDAVLVLICVSGWDGRLCGQSARFTHNDPHEAIRMAREDGWDFRNRAARCPACGRRGASFGKV